MRNHNTALPLVAAASGIVLASHRYFDGEPTLAEVMKKIDEQGKAWHQFKEATEKKLSELDKKGASDPLLEEQLKKIDTFMQENSDVKEQFEAIQKQVARTEKDIGDALDGKSNLPDHQRKAFESLIVRGFDIEGHYDYLQTAEGFDAEYKKLLAEYMRRGADGIDTKSLTSQTDPDGGYYLSPQVSANVVTKVFETSPLRQLASVETIGTDSLIIPTDRDEAVANWAGEEESRPETGTPQVGRLEIKVHELYAKPKATQKLLEDANINIEQWLARKVAERFARKENTAFISGTGVGQPRGILGYTTVADASWAWGQVGYLVTGVSGDWAASNKGDKLIDLYYALKDEYAANASWLIQRALIGEIRQFKESTTNAYIWQPGLRLGEPDTLLGAPLHRAADMPAKGANSLSVAFGDWRRAYQIVDRLGISVLRDPFSSKPYVEFYTRKRTGGAVKDFEAFKLLKFGTS